MKYIDADKLLAVLERQNADKNIINPLIRMIDSLQQEQPDFADVSKMEQPPVEDAMKALEEKIALVKENGTWDGVDVDKYMNEVRGREPEVDLEKFTEKMDNWKARYNYPDIISIKATMAFTARMFSQYPNVARLWYESLRKVTMD